MVKNSIDRALGIVVYCFCLLREVDQLAGGDFPYATISYFIRMNRVLENWPVVLFLMTVICVASIASTSY